MISLPFSKSLQRRLSAAIEKLAGLPATDLTNGTAVSYDQNPDAFMERIAKNLETLSLRNVGLATLVGGTVSVANTAVTANSVVFTQRKTAGGTVGDEYVFAVTPGVGFSISARAAGSAAASDTSVIAYMLVEPPVVAATPTADISAGTYNNDQVVAVATATPGAQLRFTLDGTNPSSLAGSVAGPTIKIGASATLKLVAVAPGVGDSAVLSRAYTLTAATPTVNVAAGTYADVQVVTIATTTTGSRIRYTLDGSDPSPTAGILYAGPITVSASATLKAIAYKDGYTNSAIFSAAYVLTVATPTATPVAGSYAGARVIELLSATPGVQMRYTVDGSTPTASVGFIYNGLVNVPSSLTLKAIAYKTGFNNSAVLTAAYTIT